MSEEARQKAQLFWRCNIFKMLMFDHLPGKQDPMEPVSMPFQHGYRVRIKNDIKPENKHSIIYSHDCHSGLFQSLEANGSQLEPVDLSLNKRHSPHMSSSPSSPYSMAMLSSASPTMNISRSNSPHKRSPQPPISMPLTIPTVLTTPLLSRSGLYSVIHPVVVQPVVYTQPIMIKEEMRNNQQGPLLQCAIPGTRHLSRQQHVQLCNHPRGGQLFHSGEQDPMMMKAIKCEQEFDFLSNCISEVSPSAHSPMQSVTPHEQVSKDVALPTSGVHLPLALQKDGSNHTWDSRLVYGLTLKCLG
ncbi:Krueppel-like factor 3 isoform X3 [Scyliorhinus torazame]|uniref:Krueppel-like factor 3 isoform X3 n=1 Tax=Scyliorhinus torazame TaxID=75743 RepID=UPI003B5A3354